MNAKEFLQQVRLCDTQINNKLEEVANLKDMVLNVTSSLGGEVVSGGSHSQDKLGDAVAKIVTLEGDINKLIDSYINKKNYIRSVVDRLKNSDQIDVLYKRYFCYKTWEEIACEMHMSYRNVCYIHGRALQSVDAILKEGVNDA
jgi:DNA-directed RNA polymerase specialized sigma subunit